MKLKKFVVGINQTNVYIIYDVNTLEGLIIDPADESKTLIQFIEANRIQLKGIIFTHYHHDHIAAAEEIKKKYGCPIYVHEKDAEGLRKPTINRSEQRIGKRISITPDKLLSHGNAITVGEIVLEVIHTPGHTPGGICLMVKDKGIIFTGDTLFDDDLGRTDLEGGDPMALRNSIRNKVSKWDDHIKVYPGHGFEALMKEVRQKNKEFLRML